MARRSRHDVRIPCYSPPLSLLFIPPCEKEENGEVGAGEISVREDRTPWTCWASQTLTFPTNFDRRNAGISTMIRELKFSGRWRAFELFWSRQPSRGEAGTFREVFYEDAPTPEGIPSA